MRAALLSLLVFLLSGCDIAALLPDAGGAFGPDSGASDAGQPDAGTLEPGVVELREGLLRGKSTDALWVYRGVPYAQPPVGAFRFRAPRPAAKWAGVKDALAPGEPCVQLDPTNNNAIVGQEDCLSLNVWAPKDAAGPLPVLFFIHGGDNKVGSSTGKTWEGDYDGASLARNGPAVVVTVNYRVAAFGWLAHPVLSDSKTNASGNWGLLDLVEALKWVQRNIAAFHGDPSRVMIFGQSAGSVNTCALLASPLTGGLFSRAAMESGPCYATPDDAVAYTSTEAASSIGCPMGPAQADCLRAAPVEKVARVPGAAVGVNTGSVYYPSVDGYALKELPIDAVRAGRRQQVPLLIGTNEHEYTSTLFLATTSTPVSDADFQAQIRAGWGDVLANMILPNYPSSAYPSPAFAFAAVFSDYAMHCPVRRTARGATKAYGPKVFRYLFTAVPPVEPWRSMGSGHGFEVPYVFDDIKLWTKRPEDDALVETMMGSWLRFADTGDPSGPGLKWEPYSATEDNVTVLDVTPGTRKGVRTAQCDFWDGTGL